MSRHVKVCLMMGAALWLGTSAAFGQVIFGAAYVGSSAAANLYSIDPTTGAGTLIGSTGLKQLSALDFNPTTGVLYGIGLSAVTGGYVLATINTATGASTLVGGVTVGPFQDLAFAGNGALYGLSGGGLWSINPSNGAATLVSGSTAGFFGDGLSFGSGGILYESTAINTDSDLASVSSTTGVATFINSHVFPPAYPTTLSEVPRIVALGFYPGSNTMYATVFAGAGGSGDLVSFLATVDLTTGVVTNVGQTVAGMDAIAIYAIPEPSITALMAVGLGLFFWRDRRRRVA